MATQAEKRAAYNRMRAPSPEADRKQRAKEQSADDDAMQDAWEAGYDGGPKPSDPELVQFYESGQKQARGDKAKGKYRAPEKSQPSRGGGRSGGGRKSSLRGTQKARGGRRRAARRRRPPLKRAARQLRNPMQRQLTSGTQALALTLAVVALYLFLENSSKVEGFIGFATRGLQWLQDPTRSISYAPGYDPGGGGDAAGLGDEVTAGDFGMAPGPWDDAVIDWFVDQVT